MKQASYWHKEQSGTIRCELCPNNCQIAEGGNGVCRIRMVKNGAMFTEGYGNITSCHLDPIEKKPLHHFYPGVAIFSIGGWGCNLVCEFCQNWSISQQMQSCGEKYYNPQIMIAMAKEGDSIGIAYTYNEPLINIEYVADCARLAREAGLKNVLVTNGFINAGPASELLKYIDAMNVDVKGFNEDFYRKYCHGKVGPVLDFVQQSVDAGCHVELTNLVIPGLNDGEDDFRQLSQWVGQKLGKHVPLHLSAYHPMYKMRIPATPAATIEKGRRICRDYLSYVYAGNVYGGEGQDTECPECNTKLIVRAGYSVKVVGIKSNKCKKCARPVDIVM